MLFVCVYFICTPYACMYRACAFDISHLTRACKSTSYSLFFALHTATLGSIPCNVCWLPREIACLSLSGRITHVSAVKSRCIYQEVKEFNSLALPKCGIPFTLIDFFFFSLVLYRDSGRSPE